MKLPRWNNTQPLEFRKTTAQLRAAPAMRQVRNERFIPTLTSEQVMAAGTAKSNAIMKIGNSLTSVLATVADAKAEGELAKAKADYLNEMSATEASITQQPHELALTNDLGQPVIDLATGEQVVTRPWEYADKEYNDKSKILEQKISDKVFTSDRAKRKFGLFVANEREAGYKRVQKWKIGHEIDRANATFEDGISKAHTHAMVDEIYRNALQNKADPAKMFKAQQEAHRNITFTALNNHLMATQTNLMNMSPDEYSQHLGSIYSDWEAVKNTLSASQNDQILSGLVAADKEYWGRGRDEIQGQATHEAMVAFATGSPMQRDAVIASVLSPDAYERYGDKGTSFMKTMIENYQTGSTTKYGNERLLDIRARTFWGDNTPGDSMEELEYLTKSGHVGVSDATTMLNEVSAKYSEKRKAENQLADRIFEGATSAVFSVLDAKALEDAKEVVADAKSDYAVLKARYFRAVTDAESNSPPGVEVDRVQIAQDVLSTMKIPGWLKDRTGKPAMSILDVDTSQITEANYNSFYQHQEDKLPRGVTGEVTQYEKARTRDLTIWRERARQTQRMIEGLQ